MSLTKLLVDGIDNKKDNDDYFQKYTTFDVQNLQPLIYAINKSPHKFRPTKRQVRKPFFSV